MIHCASAGRGRGVVSFCREGEGCSELLQGVGGVLALLSHPVLQRFIKVCGDV
jgi:hypothetical protein